MTENNKQNSSITKQNNDWPFIGAMVFTLALVFFEEFAFGHPQNAFLQQALRDPSRWMMGILTSILSIVFLFLWLYSSFRARVGWKVLYAVVFSLGVTVNYIWYVAVNRLVNVSDLQTILPSSNEGWSIFIRYFFNWLCLLPIALYILLLAVIPEKNTKKTNRIILGGLIGTLVLGGIFSSLMPEMRNKINYGTSFPGGVSVVLDFMFSGAKQITRTPVSLSAITTTAPAKNILLVIDESVRADHLSVNGYSRATTPFLEELEQKGLLYSWGTAAAGATCSVNSNLLIITGQSSIPDSINLSRSRPTVFQFAKAAGYRTYYFDAQQDYFWTGLSLNDLASIDEWTKASQLGNPPYKDQNAAKQIADILTSGTGRFIMINKKGAHWFYEDTYPAGQEIWLPLPDRDRYREQPYEVTNAYDNSILFNVNHFFEVLLADQSLLQNTIIIYTSDHGQTLFENNVDWLHCNNTRSEASVPMMILGEFSEQPDTSYPASHMDILATIEYLMFPEEQLPIEGHNLLGPLPSTMPIRTFLDGILRVNSFDD